MSHGFHDNASLELFQLLRRRVGAKAALSILSAIPVDEVKGHHLEDSKTLTKAGSRENSPAHCAGTE